MLIVSSENGRKGNVAAVALMREGGTALDAVEVACRVVEDDPADQSVGYGGLPNVRGDVELDASIMDGQTLATGAVAAVRNYGNAITLARRVMEQLPHVLLAGRGAEEFAASLGMTPADQRVEATMNRFRARFDEYGLDSESKDLVMLANELCRPVNLKDRPLWASPEEGLPEGEDADGQIGAVNSNPEANGKDDTTGTVNFLALDGYGNIASGVSTSGLAWKYPSRVGDSPIIGAGNYCDNRYGAVGCTGMGELAIKVSTARSLILYMKMGMSLHEAGLESLRDLTALPQVAGRYMNIVALTPDGGHAGFSSVPDKLYMVMTDEMSAPELAERTCLPL